jgi:hypothetical protein
MRPPFLLFNGIGANWELAEPIGGEPIKYEMDKKAGTLVDRPPLSSPAGMLV